MAFIIFCEKDLIRFIRESGLFLKTSVCGIINNNGVIIVITIITTDYHMVGCKPNRPPNSYQVIQKH